MHWYKPCKIFLFATLLLAVSSCIEPYGVPALLTDYNYLVVQGFLIDETDSTIIKLSRTTTLKNESKETAELNAQVYIEEEEGNTYVLTENGEGIYSLPPLKFNAAKRYRLHIRTRDTKEYASDFVALRQSPEINQVTWKEEDHGIRFYINIRDPENKTWYYLWTFKETWKYSSAFRSPYIYENGEVKSRGNSEELFFCWRTLPSPNIYINSTQTLSQDVVSNYPLYFISNDSRKLYYGYSLLIQQYAITKGAYEYWTTLLKNNERVGSLFDALPSQDLGNLHCLSNPAEPVLGYFSASSITRKRVMIDRQEITGPSTSYQPTGYEYCGEEFIPLDQLSLLLGNKLIIEKKYDDVTQQLTGYLVTTSDCADCRAHGGTLTKPDYWNR